MHRAGYKDCLLEAETRITHSLCYALLKQRSPCKFLQTYIDHLSKRSFIDFPSEALVLSGSRNKMGAK